MRRAWVVVTVVGVGLAGLTGCGGGDDSGGGGGDGGFSVETALADLPVPEEPTDGETFVHVADLDAASAANGTDRPAADASDDEVQDWFGTATGLVPPGSGDALPVLVPGLEILGGQGAALAEEIEEDLGFSVVDVRRYAETGAPPFRFGVVTGVGADELDGGERTREGDIWSAGTGEDLQQDLEHQTPVRSVGAPLRLAADGDRVAISSSTAAVEDWLADEADTWADDEDVTAVAAALDEVDVVSAVLVAGTEDRVFQDPARRGDLREAVITEPFSTLGLGWVDAEATVAVVYAFADEAAAETAADQVEEAFSGVSIRTREPIEETLEVEDVETDGRIVRVRLRVLGGRPPNTPWNMLLSDEMPFTHAG